MKTRAKTHFGIRKVAEKIKNRSDSGKLGHFFSQLEEISSLRKFAKLRGSRIRAFCQKKSKNRDFFRDIKF
jgi:predicted regulator of amino acid metabolism with ACT domain